MVSRYACLINKLESVQRRFTKRLKGFGRMPYAERLDRLNAETLELRRVSEIGSYDTIRYDTVYLCALKS